MTIKESQQQSASVLHLKGDLLGGNDSVEFKSKLKALVDSGKKNIIADLSGVTYVNSSGIGMLVSGLTTVSQAEGKLKLSGLEKNIQNVFVITNLIKVFETYTTLEEAAASFK